MTETTNYKLKKPGYEDYVDIGALNANADVIDEELHKLKAGKSDTVKPSVEGNLAALAADGKLQDSGRKPGEKNGVATLDENGHIPGDQLPNSFLPLKGGTMSGPINMNGQRITGLPKPAGGNDPMRKDDGASASTLGLYGLSADGTVDDVLALLGRFHIGSFARMETGSYIGTGKYGADNPNSLTFKFVPKFVLIFWAEGGQPNNAMAFLSADGGISYKPGGSNGQWFYASGIEVKITGTTITWYASSLQIQMNGSVKYQYLAIG